MLILKLNFIYFLFFFKIILKNNHRKKPNEFYQSFNQGFISGSLF